MHSLFQPETGLEEENSKPAFGSEMVAEKHMEKTTSISAQSASASAKSGVQRANVMKEFWLVLGLCVVAAMADFWESYPCCTAPTYSLLTQPQLQLWNPQQVRDFYLSQNCSVKYVHVL